MSISFLTLISLFGSSSGSHFQECLGNPMASIGPLLGRQCPQEAVLINGTCCNPRLAQFSCRNPVALNFRGQCSSGLQRLNNTCCRSEDIISGIGGIGIGGCFDKPNAQGIYDCPELRGYCNMPRYTEIMRHECPRTCGFCTSSGISSTPSTCIDRTDPFTGRSDCQRNFHLCRNPMHRDFMKRQCPRTCGYCRQF